MPNLISIIGGGPAGLAVAIALSNSGIRTIIIESGNFSKYRPGEHVSGNFKSLIAQLSISKDILDSATPCFKIESAWGNLKPEYKYSIFSPYGESFFFESSII